MTLTPSAAPEGELLDFQQEEYEYTLFDSVTSEFNYVAGFPVHYYIKTNIENADILYGEDPNETFDGPYETKLLYEPTEETDILNAFGITSDETVEFGMITKTLFSKDVSSSEVPKVGDVIRTLGNNKLYQIADVGSEQKIFQGMKMIGNFILRPYRHSEESDSAEDMLYDMPSDDNFPDINITTETEELSAYGDNQGIDDKADRNPDSGVYGY